MWVKGGVRERVLQEGYTTLHLVQRLLAPRWVPQDFNKEEETYTLVPL